MARKAATPEDTKFEPPKSGADQDADKCLLGSSMLPAMAQIAEGKEIQLGELVATSHAQSGLTVEAWNELPEEEREQKLAATLEAMRAAEVEAKERAEAEAKDAEAAKNKSMPKQIYMLDNIGWMTNGVLRQFHAGTVISHAEDIREIMAHGGEYKELK